MKIYFQPAVLYNQTNVAKQNAYNNNQAISPNFTALPQKYYRDLVKKSIVSDEEYCNILNRIYNTKISDKTPLFDIDTNKKMYPNLKKDEEGLLLYAGYGDLSDEINRFLSKREMRKICPSQASDVIRVFDYSLQKLDNKYGKYSGIVYRQGFFPNGQHQYISTTIDPVIAATLRGGVFLNNKLEFQIVKTKNGHKINTFQKKMGSEYADEEDEILLSRHSKYREITNPCGQYLSLKNKFYKILESYAHTYVNPERIKMYEEI